MVGADVVFKAFQESGIEFFTGVPDSLLKSLCAYVTDNCDATSHVIAANEGSAVGMAAGHHLATGKLPLVYMQNSGLGNAVNPLVSLADPDVYGVPMLIVVGWRGEPGKKDEPQHRKMGSVTIPSLDALGVGHAVLPTEEASALACIRVAATTAMETNAPFAIVVPKGAFAPYALQSASADVYDSSREEAIASLLDTLPKDTAIVATTGMAARELFELRKKRGESNDSDFLTVGSMGHASQIALGLSLAQPERNVVCLDGDGAAIMHLGGLTTIGSLAPKNFTHVVLNNAAHDSVGGQSTVGFDVDLCGVAKSCGYAQAMSTFDLGQLPGVMKEMLATAGPRLVEIRVRKGARKDLGRPTRTPRETKHAVMSFLNK
ncbi:MAG: phosphonopyruvate decarboxylase [Myxococcales bacterium]|nr:phosphonopyruvate decarboxylase [Myxococcales bacterium]